MASAIAHKLLHLEVIMGMVSVQRKIKSIEGLKSGKGVQYLLNEASRIFGNPIVIFDTNYNLISYAEGIVTDDPIWNEIMASGTFSRETQELFKDEGFIDEVANAKVVCMMFSDRLKYNRIHGKLFNKNGTYVANMVMVMCKNPLEPDDTAAFEALCTVLSHEMSANRFYQDYERMYEDGLIKRLIEGEAIDKGLYSAHVSILYDSLKLNLFIAVLALAKRDADFAKLVSVRNLLKRFQPKFRYSIYANSIVVIMSSDCTALDMKKDLRVLNRLFWLKGIRAGISGNFENIYDLPKHYANAVKALESGLNSKSSGRIFFFGETSTSA